MMTPCHYVSLNIGENLRFDSQETQHYSGLFLSDV